MRQWGLLSGSNLFEQNAVDVRDWRLLPRYARRMYSTTRRRLASCGLRARLGLGVQPFSDRWFARGIPIHRYYVESFLRQQAADIRGVCLEFQEDTYATRFGGPRITYLDILHKQRDGRAPQATFYADLTMDNDIPSERFDCIICTYVLHIVDDLRAFVRGLHRLLRDDGVALIVVPNITVAYPEYPELWRFTPSGLALLLAREFGSDNVRVVSYGNSLTCAGEIRGLAASDFTSAELDHNDARFGLVTCARAAKHGIH